MKKVIYCFGMMTLFAGLVSGAEALENRKRLRVGTGWNDGGAAPAKTVYSEALKTTMTQHPRTGLWGAQTTPEQQERAQTLPDRRSEHTTFAPASKSAILSSNTPTPQTQGSQLNASRSSFLSPSSSYMASSSQVSNQSRSVIIPTISREVPEASSPSRSAFQEQPMNISNVVPESPIVENPPVQAMPVDQFQLDDETRNKLEAIILPNEESTSTNSSSSSGSSSSADGNAILVSEPSIFDAMAGVVADNILLERWNDLGVALEALGIENLSFAEVLRSLGVESKQLTQDVHDKVRLLDDVQNVDAVFNNSRIKSQIMDKLYSAASQRDLGNTLNQMEFDNVKRGLSSAIAFDTVARSVIQKVGSINDKSHIFVLLNALGSTDGSQLLPGMKKKRYRRLACSRVEKRSYSKASSQAARDQVESVPLSTTTAGVKNRWFACKILAPDY